MRPKLQLRPINAAARQPPTEMLADYYLPTGTILLVEILRGGM